MNVELNVNQEQVSDTIVTARDLAHKALLASAGLVGMAYDSVKYGIENSQEVLEKAEKRGEEIEQEFTKWYDMYMETAGSGVSKLRESYDDSIEGVKGSVVGVKDVVTENTKNIPGMVVSTVATVATVRPGANGKDVPATVIEVQEEASEAMSAPFDGYDKLTAKEVIAKLDGMDDQALETVKDYEAATKNRVTVLREINVRLEKEVA